MRKAEVLGENAGSSDSSRTLRQGPGARSCGQVQWRAPEQELWSFTLNMYGPLRIFVFVP